MTASQPIWSDERFFGNKPLVTYGRNLHALKLTPPADPEPVKKEVRDITAPPKPDAKVKAELITRHHRSAKSIQRVKIAGRQVGAVTNYRRYNPEVKRTAVILRDKATCTHHQDGRLLWAKNGIEGKGQKRQRYRCPACNSGAFLVDGAYVLQVSPRTLKPDYPADMDAFLAEIAEAHGATLAEVKSAGRTARVVAARNACCWALRNRQLTVNQVAAAMGISQSTAQYCLCGGSGKAEPQ